MRRSVVWVLVAVFAVVVVEMCRELATRTYMIFGQFESSPDITTWGGIGCLAVLSLPIWLLSRRPRSP